jgi:hypothetical protein
MRTQNPKAPRTLRLERETLRQLKTDDLTKVGGGTFMQGPATTLTGSCFIMQDTVIIPTSRR